MTKQIRLIILLSTLSLVACSPDFYAEQLINQSQRQDDEERWRRVEEKLGIEVPDESQATQKSLETAFPLSSFPRETCGDPLPFDESLYPLTYYPVFIPATDDNLREVKSKFCADAYIKTGSNGEKVIMVASFYTQKASEFLLLMESNFGEARLGQSSVVSSPR
jgi:hypothetical protein